MRWFGCGIIAVGLLVTSIRGEDDARAQEVKQKELVSSGPKVGDVVPPLNAFAVSVAVKNQEIDYVAARKDKPTVYLFWPTSKDGIAYGGASMTARFVKPLDEGVKKVSADAYIVVVWLTDDPAQTAQNLKKNFGTDLPGRRGFENAAVTYFQGAKGPKEWAVNLDAKVTAVVTNKQKVAATFGFTLYLEGSPEQAAAKVEEALKNAVGK